MQLSTHQSGGKLLTQSLLPVCCAICVVISLASSAYPQDTNYTPDEWRLFSLINQERFKEGLSPLELDARLSRAARKHSQLMAQDESLSHQFDGEEALPVRFRDEHIRCDHDGENVALDSDLAVAHTMLMQSPPHRANILSPQFNAVGIGVVKSGDLLYITEDFAHVQPDYSEPQADAEAQKVIDEYAKSQGVVEPKRKPLPELKAMACNMALNDQLDGTPASKLPGVTGAVAWNTGDLEKLPPSLKKLLAQPLSGGYSLGVCFAPSVSRPGGVYWLVMVIY
jgi:uncharacterized protein YkwD